MFWSMIIVFLIFLLSITLYVFYNAFVRGGIYDVTLEHPKKGTRTAEYLKDVFEGIEYINSKHCDWHYIRSFDGLNLAARYFENKDSNKVIILFHGYRSVSENDFAGIFSYYYEAGYNILLVDQRSHGNSEGKYICFGVKERFDCVKWCEYVSENFSSIDEIILGGISMGATTVLLATELGLPSKVKGIIADCGFTSPKDIISNVMIRKYGISPEILLPLANILCRILAGFNIFECSVIDAMDKNNLPILFIHGTSDDFVPSRMSKQNFDACQGYKRLLFIDCVMHGVSCLQDKVKFRNEVSSFLTEISRM